MWRLKNVISVWIFCADTDKRGWNTWNNNVMIDSTLSRPLPCVTLTLSDTNSMKDTGTVATYLNLMVRLAGTGVALVNRNSSNRMSPEWESEKINRNQWNAPIECATMTNLYREHRCQSHNPHLWRRLLLKIVAKSIRCTLSSSFVTFGVGLFHNANTAAASRVDIFFVWIMAMPSGHFT